MVRFLVILFLLFLVFRFAAKILAKLFRVQGVFSFYGPGAERSVPREPRRSEEAEYEVIESHMRDDSPRE